jgi:hypothetical protein
MKKKLKKLRSTLKIIENVQEQCNHDWEEPQKDVIKEDFWAVDCIDADMYPSGTGIFKDVTCMSRVCKKCGKKEYIKGSNVIEENNIKLIKKR